MRARRSLSQPGAAAEDVFPSSRMLIISVAAPVGCFAVLRPHQGLWGTLRFAVGAEIRAVANKLGETRQRSERRGSDV